jgi:NAD(P)-dependent dehydrogenase (short-subunit alcohol dehydrogenase family)
MPTVLITGAGRGLGLEFAKQYAADGWRVIGTVREPKAGAALASLGKSVEVHIADMADRKTLLRLAKDLDTTPIDVLICNAGIYGPRNSAPGRIDYQAWHEVLDVNLMGPMATVEALAGNVAKSEQKKIVVISSRMASIGLNEGGEYIYRSSKAALNMIAKGLAVDLAGQGIIVAAVSPGWVKTDMGGASAPLTADVSIKGLRKVIAGLTKAKSGKFFSHDGSEFEW